MAIKAVTPFLWFDDNAEEAAGFYVSLFENSRITHVSHYSDASLRPKGSVMLVGFELQGRPFTALNGGPAHKLTEAFSLVVECTEQADIDRLWDKLGEGGSHSVCGWLRDRFGLSWQLIYAGLPDMMTGDPERAARVMAAVLQMKKIDVQALKDAAAG